MLPRIRVQAYNHHKTKLTLDSPKCWVDKEQDPERIRHVRFRDQETAGEGRQCRYHGADLESNSGSSVDNRREYPHPGLTKCYQYHGNLGREMLDLAADVQYCCWTDS